MTLCRNTQIRTNKQLGTSLADIAAFIHEQGLVQGKEVASVERLRSLALSLQTPMKGQGVSVKC